MSRTIKHELTKSCFSHLEHSRKHKKQQDAKQVEFLNALNDLNVKED